MAAYTEKTDSSANHVESGHSDLSQDKTMTNFAELAAEEVHYGYAGARAFLTSPYGSPFLRWVSHYYHTNDREIDMSSAQRSWPPWEASRMAMVCYPNNITIVRSTILTSRADQGVISLILVMPQFRSQYPKVDPSAAHYGFNTGFMTGMLLLGGFIGCLFFPYVADKLSRKWALSVAVAFFDVGAIIQTAAPDYGTVRLLLEALNFVRISVADMRYF